MSLISQSCPSCGAPLPATGEVQICTHCGNEWRVADSPVSTTPAAAKPALDKRPEARPGSRVRRWTIIAGVCVALVIGFVWLRVFGSDRFSHYRAINAAALSPDGRLLASVHGQGLETNCTLRIWDAASGAQLHRFDGVDTPMWIVHWSPDGRWLATGGQTGAIQLWNTADWQPAQRLEGAAGYARNLAWSPDSKLIATGDEHGVLRIWEAASGRVLVNEPIHTKDIEALAWSPDSRLIATGSWDNSAQIIDPSTGKSLFRFSDKSYVSCVAWSPDGKRLATGGLSNTVRLWDATSGAELRTFEGHGNSITALAWSPDGKQIASTGNDQTVRLWDVAIGKALFILDNRGYDANLMWSPDGSQLASGADGLVRLWDAANGQMQELRGHERQSRILIIAWSADSKQLVTLGAYDDTLRVWDVAAQRATSVIKISFAEAFRHALF